MKEKASVQISQQEGYVEIEFSKEIPSKVIKKQINECIGETCTCCTPSFREKVERFEYQKDDTNKVKIYGTLTKEEVRTNVTECSPKLKHDR